MTDARTSENDETTLARVDPRAGVLGIALNFLSDDPRSGPGIAFSAKTLLRLGVALLGLCISVAMLGELGLPVIGMVVGAALATVGFGLAAPRLFGFRYCVAMLAPVVVTLALILRRRAGSGPGGARPPLVPGFVAAFVALAALNSVVALPSPLVDAAHAASGWLLLIAIGAVGLKTRAGDILKVGRAAAALLLAETLFLAVLVAGLLLLIGP